jgi:hypothetical protein
VLLRIRRVKVENKPQEVKVKRTLLPTPTVDEPDRKVYQIEYRVGEMPPHFVYIPEKNWSKEAEAKLIKDDMAKRLKTTEETVTI